jgi:hypothetical protein
MEAIDNVGDFLRFVESPAREIAVNHRRLFEMEASIQEQAHAEIKVVNAQLNYLAEATLKPVHYAYDPPPESRADPEDTSRKPSPSATAANHSINSHSTPTVSC